MKDVLYIYLLKNTNLNRETRNALCDNFYHIVFLIITNLVAFSLLISIL